MLALVLPHVRVDPDRADTGRQRWQDVRAHAVADTERAFERRPKPVDDGTNRFRRLGMDDLNDVEHVSETALLDPHTLHLRVTLRQQTEAEAQTAQAFERFPRVRHERS